MVNRFSCLLLFAFFLNLNLTLSKARSTAPAEPQSIHNFEIKLNQTTARSCSYTVTIKTSCSSTSYTRDKISLAFGDAYGNEVYAARLDDPQSRTFERCSSDTFQIRGPCLSEICYLYLRRSGSDGWKPESVKVYGPDRRTLTFNYNSFLPNGVWFGFDHCSSRSNSKSQVM